MTDNVVALSGGPVPEAKEPNEQVVKALEAFLALARSGEVQGVVLVGAGHDRRTTYANYHGMVSYSLVGRMEQQKSDIIAFLSRD